MNVHAFMNELDQKDYYENLCTKSMESCPLVISHILAVSFIHRERKKEKKKGKTCVFKQKKNTVKKTRERLNITKSNITKLVKLKKTRW